MRDLYLSNGEEKGMTKLMDLVDRTEYAPFGTVTRLVINYDETLFVICWSKKSDS